MQHPFGRLGVLAWSLVVGCTTSSPIDSSPTDDTLTTKPTGATGTSESGTPTSDTAVTADELSALDDSFDNAKTLTDWRRVWVDEAWPGDQLEVIDVDTSAAGMMFMQPYSSAWFADYRGALAFKEVTGDFVVTTRVQATDRAMKGAPGADFSLAGLMIRAPRSITAKTWTPGGENYVFLSQGAATTAGVYSGEIKTTTDSRSTLDFPPGAADARVRVARIGAHIICLLDVGKGWTVAQWRYHRPDLPDTLQVGLTAYTDWSTVNDADAADYNRTVLSKQGNPDLTARFDWITYRRPVVPAELVGADLSNSGAVGDDVLLSFLGDPD